MNTLIKFGLIYFSLPAIINCVFKRTVRFLKNFVYNFKCQFNNKNIPTLNFNEIKSKSKLMSLIEINKFQNVLIEAMNRL